MNRHRSGARSRSTIGGRDEVAGAHEVTPAATIRSLVPLAAALALVGTAVWWLLDRGSSVAPWLVAAILVAHGWVHLVFLLPRTQPREADDVDNPFDMDRSWVIRRGADRALVRRLGSALALVTFVALFSAGLAVVGWLVPAGWWSGLVISGVLGSAGLLVLFFAPTLVLGLVIDAGLLALALQATWAVHR